MIYCSSYYYIYVILCILSIVYIHNILMYNYIYICNKLFIYIYDIFLCVNANTKAIPKNRRNRTINTGATTWSHEVNPQTFM